MFVLENQLHETLGRKIELALGLLRISVGSDGVIVALCLILVGFFDKGILVCLWFVHTLLPGKASLAFESFLILNLGVVQ